MAPNGLELTGDGGAAAGGRCSDLLGNRCTRSFFIPSATERKGKKGRYSRNYSGQTCNDGVERDTRTNPGNPRVLQGYQHGASDSPT